jgi:hypothetical protein
VIPLGGALLLPEVHVACVGDAITMAGQDIDRGATVVENLKGIEISVFVVLDFDLNVAFVFDLSLAVIAYALLKVQALASSVGHLINASEIG